VNLFSHTAVAIIAIILIFLAVGRGGIIVILVVWLLIEELLDIHFGQCRRQRLDLWHALAELRP
jgi:uncharacterized membrane protein YpjA